jgi:hypothetical protein
MARRWRMEAVHTYPQQWQEDGGWRLYIPIHSNGKKMEDGGCTYLSTAMARRWRMEAVHTYPQQWQEDGGWKLYIPIHSNGKKMEDGSCTAEDIAAGPHITKSGAQAPLLAYLEKRKVLVSTYFGNSIPYSLHNVRDNLILFPVQVLLEKNVYCITPVDTYLCTLYSTLPFYF